MAGNKVAYQIVRLGVLFECSSGLELLRRLASKADFELDEPPIAVVDDPSFLKRTQQESSRQETTTTTKLLNPVQYQSIRI